MTTVNALAVLPVHMNIVEGWKSLHSCSTCTGVSPGSLQDRDTLLIEQSETEITRLASVSNNHLSPASLFVSLGDGEQAMMA